MRVARLLTTLAVSVTVALMLAPPAFAGGWHVPLVRADFLGVGHLAGSVLGALGGAVLGGLNWTVSVAAKVLLAVGRVGEVADSRVVGEGCARGDALDRCGP
jgi:hypothetical protein